MILDHAVPDWRPGAVYWRPLDDGNEITVYPTLFGGGQLCLGPLADAFGFDAWWQYPHLSDCLSDARTFDGEGDPPGLWHKAAGSDFKERRKYAQDHR